MDIIEIESINNPHDKFFKKIFSDKDQVIDFMEGLFPNELKMNFSLSTLKLDPNSYIDEKLKESFSDVVYNCLYKGAEEIKISLLFEHKSGIPDNPYFQLLRYILNINELDQKQKEEELKVVIPIIVYHGERKWKKKKFKEYFKCIDELLSSFIPDFQYVLIDLTNYSDDDIKNKIFKRVTTKIACLLFKNIYDEQKLRSHLKEFLKIGKLYFEEEKGLKFLESVIKYIYSTTDIPTEEMVNVVKQISYEGGERAMTTAMRLMNEGKEKWMNEGIKNTKKKMVINLFKNEHLPLEKIARFVDVDMDFVKKVLDENE